jgi:hypothetical protein
MESLAALVAVILISIAGFGLIAGYFAALSFVEGSKAVAYGIFVVFLFLSAAISIFLSPAVLIWFVGGFILAALIGFYLPR